MYTCQRQSDAPSQHDKHGTSVPALPPSDALHCSPNAYKLAHACIEKRQQRHRASIQILDIPIGKLCAIVCSGSWRKQSKLFHELSGYSEWYYVVGYIFGMRSGDITDAFLASDLLSWKDAIAQIVPQAGGLSASRELKSTSLEFAVSATIRYGLASDDESWWLGQDTADLDSTGRVEGIWNWNLLHLGNADVQCAVFHQRSGETFLFDVMYYRPGARSGQRAFGMYSLRTGRWSLYSNTTSGLSEVPRDEVVCWLVPMLQTADGSLVETSATECTRSLFYMRSDLCVHSFLLPHLCRVDLLGRPQSPSMMPTPCYVQGQEPTCSPSDV